MPGNTVSHKYSINNCIHTHHEKAHTYGFNPVSSLVRIKVHSREHHKACRTMTVLHILPKVQMVLKQILR